MAHAADPTAASGSPRALALPGRRKPYVLAHRGNRVACPENTLASFRRALEEGADILETDLWVTAYDAFVCIHDAMLDRTTDGNGSVGARTLAVRAGLWAASGRAGFAAERIAAGAEVAALLLPDRGLALELKS